MRAKAGVRYHTAGVNYEMAGVCCSAMAKEQRSWQSAELEGGFRNIMKMQVHWNCKDTAGKETA